MAKRKDPGNTTDRKPGAAPGGGPQDDGLFPLPQPSAPSNDNDVGRFMRACRVLARHMSWLAPTLALAAFSLFLILMS